VCCLYGSFVAKQLESVLLPPVRICVVGLHACCHNYGACCNKQCVSAVLCAQAAYDAAPLLPPEGAVKGPCLLGSLSFLTDDFDWEGES
jgi:hypothetical protein